MNLSAQDSSINKSLAQSEISGQFGNLVSQAAMTIVKFRNGIIKEFSKAIPGNSPEQEFMRAVLDVMQPVPNSKANLPKALRGAVSRLVVEANKAKKNDKQLAQADHLLEATRYANAAWELLGQFVPKEVPKSSIPTSMDRLVSDVIQERRLEQTRMTEFLTRSASMVRHGDITPQDLSHACHDHYESLVPETRGRCKLGHQVNWAKIMSAAVEDHTRALSTTAALRQGGEMIVHQAQNARVVVSLPATPDEVRSSARVYHNRGLEGLKRLLEATLTDCSADRLPVHVQAAIAGRPASTILQSAELEGVASRVMHIGTAIPPRLLSGVPTPLYS